MELRGGPVIAQYLDDLADKPATGLALNVDNQPDALSDLGLQFFLTGLLVTACGERGETAQRLGRRVGMDGSK